MTVTSWDDIDLGGLTMEGPDEFSGERLSGKEKRQAERLEVKKLKRLNFSKVQTIPVDIENVTRRTSSIGAIEDISSMGIRLSTEGQYEISDMVRLVFSIGTHRLNMRAQVRWVKAGDEHTAVGMKFVDPGKENVIFIKSLFSTVYLR